MLLPAIQLLQISLEHLQASSITQSHNLIGTLVRSREAALASKEASMSLDAACQMPRLSNTLAWALAALLTKGMLNKNAAVASTKLCEHLIRSMCQAVSRTLPFEALPFFLVLLLQGQNNLEERLEAYQVSSPTSLLTRLSLDTYEPQMLAIGMLSSMAQETQHMSPERHTIVLQLLLEITQAQPACVAAL